MCSSSNVSHQCDHRNNLVDQILEQGQRLRNSMVESILNNDPLNVSAINYKHKACNHYGPKVDKALSTEEEQLFLSYLHGDSMSKVEEKQALDTFRRMSLTDICNLTDRSCLSYKATCNCSTCKAYYNYDVPLLNLRKLQHESSSNNNKAALKVDQFTLLKYVDSLKISVHSLAFNLEGLKKINRKSNVAKLPPSYSHSYFVEYSIPGVILPANGKIKAKVDTGMNNNKIRFCSKLVHNEVIHFKQSSIHEVAHLDVMELNKLIIRFVISCRTQKQKGAFMIGVAGFDLSSFQNTKYLTTNQELAIMLDCDAPIVLGTLKISAQLGCDKIYFGKELIDAISSSKENNVVLSETVLEPEDFDNHYDNELEIKAALNAPSSSLSQSHFASKAVKENLRETLKKVANRTAHEAILEKNRHLANSENTNLTAPPKCSDKQIVFGFIYISEAEFLDPLSTYFVVRLFGQDDLLYSRTVHHSSNPVYDFHQVIPYVYDDTFVQQLRDNFMIFEFYEKCVEGDLLIGVSKVSLHQFYVSFRNPAIYNYLLRNEFPVIGADWWESITDPVDGKLHGQAQILVAFGSEKQIQNLELSRGFCDEKVVAKKSYKINEHLEKFANKKQTNELPKKKLNLQQPPANKRSKPTKPILTRNSKPTPPGNKSPKPSQDKAIQFNVKNAEMANNADQNVATDKDNTVSINKDTLGEFLSQLIQQRQTTNYVETSTNTDEDFSKHAKTKPAEESPVKRKHTSQLLDTLQEALSVNRDTPFCNTGTLNEHKNCFKAHIHIEKALHLPAKKKCRAKKSKNKNVKQEEIPPNSYVTFETMPNEMTITPIVQKSCNPIWDFRCDVILPSDLLTNSQKRLIIKVWKKCAGNSTEPNLQTDLIIGFAALDLTVFMAGLPTVSGWFNILDFTSRCNGQIKIDVAPMENVSRFKEMRKSEQQVSTNSAMESQESTEEVEEPHETLSRALKRKFIELDEITQRLRLRLSNVTNDEAEFNDELADEFEHDINTLCVEDDYNLIDFEDGTGNKTNLAASKHGLLGLENPSEDTSMASSMLSLSMPESSSYPPKGATLDKELREGKERIDSLLQKLSIITSEGEAAFPSRHVSGCSINNQEPANNGTLKDFVLDGHNINADCILNPLLFRTLCEDSETTSNSDSSTSVHCDRAAPDGARSNLNDKA